MRLKYLIAISIGLTLINTGCATTEDEPEVVVQPTIEWSEAEEINHWIYEQMNHHYLWREDLPDSLACDYKLTPKEFFESLLSDKDRFSYLGQKSSRSIVSHELGFAYQEHIDRMGNKFLEILYIKSNNVLSSGLKRGDLVKILGYEGNIIRLERFSFDNNTIQSTGQFCYEIDTRSKTNETVQLDTIYNIGNKKIGYLCYLEFDAPSDFSDAFNKFNAQNIDELVLDLRYNPGGLVNTCHRLCNMIVPESAYGQLFQQSSYNDIIAQENIMLYGNERTFIYFDVPNIAGPTLGPTYSYLKLNKLYVITSKNTASASESTINSLKPYMDVIVIGENTVGKGVGMYTLSSSKYKYSLVPITFRFYNALGETIPDSGIIPDYYIEDGNLTHKKDLGDLTEPLLSKAIELITSTPNTTSIGSRSLQSYEISLTPIGEPSYVTEFKNKQYNENN